MSNVAGQAIKVAAKLKAIRVENCELSSCGGGGIYVSGSNNVIYNNLIHDIGLIFPSAVGIYAAKHNYIISHNEIHDVPYSGIIFGGEDTVIDHNLVYRSMQVLVDGAAFYTSPGRNIVLRNNVARDSRGMAYYLDELTDDCLMENNVSLNIHTVLNGHSAKNDILRNNVFVNNGDLTLFMARCKDYKFQGNVSYAKGKISIIGVDGAKEWSDNLFYSVAGSIVWSKWKSWTERGPIVSMPAGNEIGDPLFVDLAKDNLRYKPESPALKLGIRPLDISVRDANSGWLVCNASKLNDRSFDQFRVPLVLPGSEGVDNLDWRRAGARHRRSAVG